MNKFHAPSTTLRGSLLAIALLGTTACDDFFIWEVPTGYGADTDGDFSYNIQECSRYDVFDCYSTDVDEITDLFENTVTPKFSGERLHDGSSECVLGGQDCPLPSQAAESTEMFGAVPGQDDQYADSAGVFVFAGHGGSTPLGGPALSYTILDPGNPDAGCNAHFKHHIRLGRYGGAKARVGIYAASCIGAGHWHEPGLSITSWYQSFAESLTWQHLAFQDSPSILTNELKKFAMMTKLGVDNSFAWRSALEMNSAYSAWNQPVAITRAKQGATYEQLVERTETANFYTMEMLPEPKGSTGLILVDDTFSFDLYDPEPSGCDFY